MPWLRGGSLELNQLQQLVLLVLLVLQLGNRRRWTAVVTRKSHPSSAHRPRLPSFVRDDDRSRQCSTGALRVEGMLQNYHGCNLVDHGPRATRVAT